MIVEPNTGDLTFVNTEADGFCCCIQLGICHNKVAWTPKYIECSEAVLPAHMHSVLSSENTPVFKMAGFSMSTSIVTACKHYSSKHHHLASSFPFGKLPLRGLSLSFQLSSFFRCSASAPDLCEYGRSLMDSSVPLQISGYKLGGWSLHNFISIRALSFTHLRYYVTYTHTISIMFERILIESKIKITSERLNNLSKGTKHRSGQGET